MQQCVAAGRPYCTPGCWLAAAPVGQDRPDRAALLSPVLLLLSPVFIPREPVSDQSHDQQAPWIAMHDAPPVRAAHTREQPAHDHTRRGPVYLLLPVAPCVGTRGRSARTSISIRLRVLYGLVIVRLPA